MSSAIWVLPGLATLMGILVSVGLIVVALVKVRPVHKHAGMLMAAGAGLSLLVRVAHPFISSAVVRAGGDEVMEWVAHINAASGMLAAVGALMVVVGIALLAERQRPEPAQF